MQSEEPTIIQSLENHLAEYGHTTVGQDIAAAILVIKDLHQKAALSAQVQDVAVEDVLSERKRQVEREGWTPEHDDAYTEYELAWAAITYAMAACADSAERAVMDQFGDHSATPGRINENWPWDWKWWKPKDRRRDLVRAAALIIAEIERLDRAAAPAKQEGGTNE